MQVGAWDSDLHVIVVKEGDDRCLIVEVGASGCLIVEEGIDLFCTGWHLTGLLEAPLLLREVLQVPQPLEDAPLGVDAEFLGEGLGDVHGLATRGATGEQAVDIDETCVLQPLPVD